MTVIKETSPAVKGFLERLRARRPELQMVEIEGLGVVYMRRPTGADQIRITAIKQGLESQGVKELPVAALAAIAGAVLLLQEDGTPFFEDPEAGYHELAAIPAQELEALYAKIAEIAMPELTKTAVENAEKKSSSDQNSQPGTN